MLSVSYYAHRVRNTVLALIGLVTAVVVIIACTYPPQVLETFDGSSARSNWKWSNGSEFPGATGYSAIGDGSIGKGLIINYDFSGGGRYVGVTRTLPTPRRMVGCRLLARLPGDATLSVQILDGSGQWLTYRARRPLSARVESEWFKSTVEFGTPNSYWAGANDGRVHQPIRALRFNVSAVGPRKIGSAALDHIEAFEAFEFDLDPMEAPIKPAAAGVSDLRSGLGVVTADIGDLAGLDAARGGGVSVVRAVLFWDQVELRRGVYSWDKWDQYLDALDARGMRALFVLAYSNALYPIAWPLPSETKNAFYAFARAAAQRYAGRGVRFEVWNEPDHEKYWPPRDPAVFAQFVSAAVDAVRAGDPNAQVATGGLGWFDFEYFEPMLKAGAAVRSRAIAIHPYRGVQGPEGLIDDATRARVFIRSTVANNPPLWDTEWGYTSTQFGRGHDWEARKRQAVLGVRRMVSSRVTGFPFAMWYGLRDQGTDPAAGLENFGLIDAAGGEKPVLKAIRAMSRAANGRTVAGLLNIAQPLLSGVRLDGASDTVWMVWSTAKGHDVLLRVPRPTRAVNVFGDPLSLAHAYTLREANGPIYLTFQRTAALAAAPPAADGFGETEYVEED